MNYGFVIDNRKCIGCHACTVACKSEHQVPIGVNRTHVKYIEKGTFPNSVRKFSVHRCNHCEDAPCAEICPTSALYTRQDGIVDFDNDRCIGCKSCMQACPYDALYIDPDSNTAAKCNYCSHRVDAGYQPACVVVCPTQAILSGDLDDPNSKIAQTVAMEPVTVRKPEKDTKPNLFYVEGDDYMLDPSASPRRDDYFWSEQSGGVGHFAKEAAGGDDQRIIGNVAQHLDDKQGRRVYDTPAKGVLWGWEVPAYLWTKAIATGSFLMFFWHAVQGGKATEGHGWWPIALSLVFLGLTGALLVKDLDRPDRFLYVLLRPNWKSWLVRGAYIITGFGLAMTGMLIAAMTETEIRWLPIPALIFAILGAVYTAFLFGQAKGRDFWQSPLSPVQMLAHALMAGAAALMVIEPETHGTMSQALLVILPLNLGLIAAESMTPSVSADVKRTHQMMTRGPYAWMFYSGILIGHLVPLILILALGASSALAVSAMVLAGIFVLEYARVLLPQLIPLS